MEYLTDIEQRKDEGRGGIKYKGFIILPEYQMCFKTDKFGNVTDCKQTKKDITHYGIYDPINNDKLWIAEDTIAECKATIDNWLKKVNMVDNTQKSWDKLD